ncbi:T6SS immunity protein Tli3 family protein, partial [Escherichia coli]
MLKEWMIFTCSLLTLAGASLPLSGCISRGQESISEGAAFGAGILREPGATKKADTKDLNVPPPVYGPPQVIFRIDDNRYFTLENYTHCENGQTFYNNKAKNIHVKILDASG